MTYPTLLPPNSTPFERDMEQVQARLHEIPIDFEKLWRVNDCPIELLPWLAWSLSVDYWNSDWTEEKKREVVANSLYIHQHKGTIAAVKRALLLADASDASLSEWFEYEGKPKTFQISLPANHPAIANRTQQKEMLRLVFDAKPCAAHLGFPDPTDPDILVPGLKVTDSFSQFDPIRLLLAGNVHDLRKPVYETTVQFKVPQIGIVITHLTQNQPIPLEVFIPHPTHLEGFGSNKRFIFPKKRYVDVFKPLPEGEISPGEVKVRFDGQIAEIIADCSSGFQAIENAVTSENNLSFSTVLTPFVRGEQQVATMHGFLPHGIQSIFWSGNQTQPNQNKVSYVKVFKPIPEGVIGIGLVIFSVEMQDTISMNSISYGTETRANAHGFLPSAPQGFFFSIGQG